MIVTFMGDRIYLPCAADYDIGDCLEVERVKIPSGEGVSADGGLTAISDGDQFYIVDDGKGVAGDVDACGNDMEGVPYIKVSLIEDGTPSWDTSKAGEEINSGALTGNLTLVSAGSGYSGGNAGILTDVELISALGGGKGAKVTVEVNAAGEIVKATVTNGGSGQVSDMLGLA